MALRTLVAAPTADDFFSIARARFVAGERIDVAGIAEAVGVSRATAYRWAGNADHLVARVIASLAEDTFRRSVHEAKGRGWNRILDAIERGLRYISTFPPYRAFLEHDPENALRIVASKNGAPQQTMIRLHQELLEDEARRGRITLPTDAHTLAYAIVRISESFLYADLIANEQPDVDKAMAVLRLLCRSSQRR